jgi:hypothetical protein
MPLGGHPAQKFLPFAFCLLSFDFLLLRPAALCQTKLLSCSPPNPTVHPGMPRKGPELGEPRKSAFRVN